MKKEFTTCEVKFVYSKDELGYQEVLDDIPFATEVTIVTFNISEKRNDLINALYSAREHCTINVITNIPGRWEEYYGDSFRKRAQKKIKLYISKLNPKKLGNNSAVFFDFSNHGKIIMTNNIVYVGSANFSEESKNNTEFGFISRDSSFIEYIRSQVLPDMIKSSIPYYEENTELLLEGTMAISAVYNMRSELHENAYYVNDEFNVVCYYYKENEAFLTVQLLNRIELVIEEAMRVAEKIYNVILAAINDGVADEDDMMDVGNIHDELVSTYKYICTVLSWDTLQELASFDVERDILQQLEFEYGMEAYDENLESCMKDAAESTVDTINRLTGEAHEDVEILLSELDEFVKKYSKLTEKLSEIKKINSRIDNT